jgi:hypothetical protein
LTFLRGEYKRLTNEHVQHCLNYLRQSFLCMSDDSLELGDSMAARGDIFGGVGICRDWEKVNELVDINLTDWLKWNASNSSLWLHLFEVLVVSETDIFFIRPQSLHRRKIVRGDS